MGALKRVSVAFLLAAAPAMAQLNESTTVEVVQIPVYVTAHGTAVSSLTRDNFRLFVNGKPQAIDYFDTLDFASLPGGPSADPHQRRLYMLLFDLTFSPAPALQHAQKAAVSMIESAAPSDTFGIATLDPDGGARIIMPFSRDRVALLRAIRSLRPSQMPDPLHLALTTAERQGMTPGGLSVLASADLGAMESFDSDLLRDAIENAIGDLADLGARLAPIEGIKHIVLLSTGFDSSAMFGRGRGPDPTAIEFRQRQLAFSNALIDAVQKMHRTFAAASVFLDALDIAGLRPMQSLGDDDALYAMVEDTGGEVIDRGNDLGRALRSLAHDQSVVYVLSFNANQTGRERNGISVDLVDAPRGSHAYYRRSYASHSDPPDLGDPLLLADVVMNDIPQTGVTTTARVVTAPGKATVEVECAAGELVPLAGGMTLVGKVLLYVFSGSQAVAFREKEISIEPRAMQALAKNPVRFAETFDLPPGPYAAKVLVRFGLDRSNGFAHADFTVPR